MTRLVYRFGVSATDGRAQMKDLLGGKGANLAEMAAAGLPVPPGFTISTAVCKDVSEHHGELPKQLWPEIDAALAEVEAKMELKFGDSTRPLLVSVRSGAAVSMPGMMDTVLNLGMNDAVAEGLAKRTNNPRFAWDAYRRFIQMFADVVMDAKRSAFEDAMDALKHERGAKTDQELTADDLHELVNRFKKVYRDQLGQDFPSEPRVQLERAILAVFRSWMSERAVKYREVQQIRGLLGTAVNVQAMVFGNMGQTSGTGVCFTRNPATGAKELYGEYLIDAQGEDVVAGTRTPLPISTLRDKMPEIHGQLVEMAQRLERHFKNVQDIEFTVQESKLFLLQTRHGKRTGAAAVKVAVDLVAEGLVTKEEAIANLVEPTHVDQLLHPHFADENGYRKAGKVLAKGLNASPGAAVGRIVFDADVAEEWKSRGEKVILARIETSPEDVAGMHAAEGVLTTRGGMTSHAAVVARGWGKPCVAGVGELQIDYRAKTLKSGDRVVKEGDWISLNGTTGEVIEGKAALADALVSGELATFMAWVDEVRTLKVRTNADTPKDAKVARDFGAEGIGLVRTEHMFFEESRIQAMREMILADTVDARKKALAKLLPHQREDFVGIFRVMEGLPVTIRLLDPPLHEFLPHERVQQDELARVMGVNVERLRSRVASLGEANPMLGHRGCRLGITHPEITEMQARAILEAACSVTKEGKKVLPEIMVPLVGHKTELANQKAIVLRVAEDVFREQGMRVEFKVGTMIEVPRAALRAAEIAEDAEFFSFGTNDLTQMTLGFSRDDIASFLPKYLAQGVLQDDPFQTLDVEGVGQLVKLATENGRKQRPGMKIGICGEHGGDPRSIAFCADVGLDYVSCSPFRVPVARLAAAQSALKKKGVKGKVGEA
ncbi:pyruvate, phosphate dikinase [Sandaracinus amylolyticus]|uniref:Pyruvate, phosphate dikinase n=1 Tax=Sandaracinus amylolyticus TaxID=927083 RepID=A0A0F6VZB3_9BACT|nr:pyruvate, phosphate dikinase [Sandaracinus amylolyticus]AKF03455.1 Pyruvate,phosphate dikinase [Sandaracinus amylolyticus]